MNDELIPFSILDYFRQFITEERILGIAPYTWGQVVMEFPNGYGASIVKGFVSAGLLEIVCLKDGMLHNDPERFSTPQKAFEHLKEIMQIEKLIGE